MSYHYHINCDGGCGVNDPTWDSVPDGWVQASQRGSGGFDSFERHYCPECWAKMIDILAVSQGCDARGEPVALLADSPDSGS